MSGTVAEILETPGEGMPFKVVFSVEGKSFAEHPVNSRLSADELIAAVLPVLQGFSAR